MKILLVGGGTGGHITPNLAVAHELKQIDPGCVIDYVLEKDSRFGYLLDHQSDIDKVHVILAGKFRRYHTEKWYKRLIDVRTNMLNVRDVFRTLAGCTQAWNLLRRTRPDVIFIKGGFVAVPVGLAAVFFKIPYITHDSDSLPGLANRLIGRWAAINATGMPAELYSYPQAKTRFVGILLNSAYQPVTEVKQKQLKTNLGLSETQQVLLITGGSQGAQRLNTGMASIVPQILERYPNLTIFHQVGKGNSNTYSPESLNNRLIVSEYFDDMFNYSGAADVVVTRGGANTLGELAVQGKACIVVPNPLLTGGHQLKNAQYMLEREAIEVVLEPELSTKLYDVVCSLLDDEKHRHSLSEHLMSLGRLDAARDISLLLLELVRN